MDNGGKVRHRGETHIIGKVNFFHTDSECREIEGTFALEADIPKSGVKFWSCHLLDI